MRLARSLPASRALLVLTAAFVAAVACGGPSGRDGGGAPAARGPEVAPDFSLPDLEGKAVRLSDSAGKVRLVDFWATWCAPCREEVPAFKEMHAKYKDRGFELIAISMDEEGEKVVRPFVEKAGITYTTLLGNEEVGEAFGGILGYPSAFLIDRDGKIVARYVGSVPKRVFETRIREMLGLDAAS